LKKTYLKIDFNFFFVKKIRIVAYLRKIIPIFKLFFENINSRYTLKDLLILFSIIVKNFIGYALFIYVKDLIDIRYFNE